MNCLEVRRQKLADPRRISDEANRHSASCSACQLFAQSVDETEVQLARTFEVNVPEGLAERMLLGVKARERRGRAGRYLAIATMVLVAIAVGWLHLLGVRSNDHAGVMVAHVLEEPQSLTAVSETAPADFQQALFTLGGELAQPLGEARYVHLCIIDGQLGWHVVVRMADGLATVLFVPGKRLPREGSATARGWSVITQAAGPGYYAVIAQSAHAALEAEKLMRQRVRWSA